MSNIKILLLTYPRGKWKPQYYHRSTTDGKNEYSEIFGWHYLSGLFKSLFDNLKKNSAFR